jgi:hypothetical protein
MTLPPSLLERLSGNDAGGLQFIIGNRHSTVGLGAYFFVYKFDKKAINPGVYLRNIAVVIKSEVSTAVLLASISIHLNELV